jgi:hypothetical protein
LNESIFDIVFMRELKSFYTLELFISPGGGRKATIYVLGSLAEIQQAIEVEFSRSSEINLLLIYGEDVWLSTYHQGEIVQEINLLPYIKVEIPGEGTFSIDENRVVSPPIIENYYEDGSLSMRLAEDLIDDYTVIIDWSKLEIPDLISPILQPGEITPANDRYTGDRIERSQLDEFLQCQDPEQNLDLNIIDYGWNDGEAGITGADLDRDDPAVTLQAFAKHIRFQ